MDPADLLKRLNNTFPPQQETDSFGRTIPSRSEIEHAIGRSQTPQLSKKQLRHQTREERRGRGPERS